MDRLVVNDKSNDCVALGQASQSPSLFSQRLKDPKEQQNWKTATRIVAGFLVSQLL